MEGVIAMKFFIVIALLVLLTPQTTQGFYIASCDSMLPTIRCDGTTKYLLETAVKIGSTQKTEFNIGDIIVFKLNNIERFKAYKAGYKLYSYWIHRIVNISEEGYTTKGDANSYNDPWIVKKEWIVWKFSIYERA